MNMIECQKQKLNPIFRFFGGTIIVLLYSFCINIFRRTIIKAMSVFFTKQNLLGRHRCLSMLSSRLPVLCKGRVQLTSADIEVQLM